MTNHTMQAGLSSVTENLFDAVVIGTGFGGGVAACRLAQAQKKVCILERGRRYGPGDFPRPAERPDHLPHTARWAWALDHGLWDVKDLQGTLAVQAAGYGGGSLVYANVHLRPPPHIFSAANGWPGCYSRSALDSYYDVVAAVLRVRPLPATPSASSGLSGPLPKAAAMRAAATALGREPWFFLPPLAIDFDKCTMRGECVAGCQIQAKNTLDLNYLAAAECQPDLDVRTLAEAVDLQEEEDGTYTITYYDHITGKKEEKVRAKSVFLCAGSVNSTHILLRSKDKLPIPDPSKKQIGRRFFVNRDAIAMVYDTTNGPVPTPTLGPTIATALLYNPSASPSDWFLLQDGGYPKFLESKMGLFRGEFWLERNRIRCAPVSPTPQKTAVPTKHREEIGRALLGLLHARPAVGLGLGDILPVQILDKLVPNLRGFTHRFEAGEAGPVSRETLAEVSRRLIESKPAWLRPLVKWFVQFADQQATPYLLESTLEILHQHFLKAPAGTAEPFTAAVLWPLAVEAAQKLFFGSPPNDHTFVTLVMGLDAVPGVLYLDDDDRLFAYWDLAANAPFSTTEEQFMHDVAAQLGGELRLNPDVTARQRPVTVHSLGGCAMADSLRDGVTDPNGKVWGTRALYVLDGAAIPSSLGTNPSATIAAIAERNVRQALQDPMSPVYTPTPVPLDPPLPGGPTLKQIQLQLGQTAAVLDPIAGIPSTSSPPSSPAVGLSFKEVMQGFYDTPNDKDLPIRSELLATINDFNAFLVNPRHPVEISGTVWLTPIRGKGQVPYGAHGTLELLKRVHTVRSLDALLREGRRRLRVLRRLKAPSLLPLSPVQAQEKADTEAAMASLLHGLEKRPHRYEMDYHLKLTAPGGSEPTYKFTGVKRIYGRPGYDAWEETTTLDVMLLLDPTGEPAGHGVMHVHLADFLKTQLPSFQVTGTQDDVRIAWALGRFFRFFLGSLRQVYVPRTDILDPFGDRRS